MYYFLAFSFGYVCNITALNDYNAHGKLVRTRRFLPFSKYLISVTHTHSPSLSLSIHFMYIYIKRQTFIYTVEVSGYVSFVVVKLHLLSMLRIQWFVPFYVIWRPCLYVCSILIMSTVNLQFFILFFFHFDLKIKFFVHFFTLHFGIYLISVDRNLFFRS